MAESEFGQNTTIAAAAVACLAFMARISLFMEPRPKHAGLVPRHADGDIAAIYIPDADDVPASSVGLQRAGFRFCITSPKLAAYEASSVAPCC